MSTRKLALWVVVVGLASGVVLQAQPRGPSGMGGGTAPEQILGLLAIDEKFNVTDKQLLALREALKPIYVERQKMLAEMFSGGTDFRAMRQKMRDQQAKMRDQIMAALATSLGDEQIEALKAHLQQQQQGPRSRGSQRGGPSGGGGPGGGGF